MPFQDFWCYTYRVHHLKLYSRNETNNDRPKYTPAFFAILGSVNSSTKLILVNVLHFKSDWMEEFIDTINNEFKVNGNKPITGTTEIQI